VDSSGAIAASKIEVVKTGGLDNSGKSVGNDDGGGHP
jgi:hypothetical protein